VLTALCLLAWSWTSWAAWPAPQGAEPLPATVRTSNTQRGDPVAPFLLKRVPLGDVSFYVKGGALPDTFVKFSPDSRLLAIGTFVGRIKLLDVYSGRIRWERKVAEGMVKTIDFAPDSQTVFFGEQSVDGLVYAADARTGADQWAFRLADDLESSAPPGKDDPWEIYHLPGSFRLKALADGGLLVLGVHTWGDYERPNGVRRWSRVYRLSSSGKTLWAFPKAEPAPMSFVHMDADRGGRRVALLATDLGSNAPDDFDLRPGTLYSLDGATGDLVGGYTFPPLEPYFDVVWFWHSVSVGPKGRRAGVGLFDGRSYLFDLDTVRPLHEFGFGAPVRMGDVPVSASATYTTVAPDGVAYFQTGVSSVPLGSKAEKVTAPPGPHPNANTINAVDGDGNVLWRYRSGHHYQNFWTNADGRWVITSAEKQTEDGQDAGVILFDVARAGGGSAKFVYYFQVGGRCFFNADISPDGAAIAVVEVPYVDPETKMLVGDYQVHVIR